jgi:large subunit ribosomal protein L20
MPRVKRAVGSRRRKKKIFQKAKGFFQGRRKLLRSATETLMRGGAFGHKHRRTKKRDFRGLFVQRINAGAREHGLSYSRLINGLKIANVEINRKMLSEMAIHDPNAFAKICEQAKNALPPGTLKKAAPKAA